MPSSRFPGVEALDAFLRHHLAGTPLARLTPFEYVLQYLELPLDEHHDIEETYELFWGVCCLDIEFDAFNQSQQNKRRSAKQAITAGPARIAPKVDIQSAKNAVKKIQPIVLSPADRAAAIEAVRAAGAAAAAYRARSQSQAGTGPQATLTSEPRHESIRQRTLELEAENRRLERSIARLSERLQAAKLEPHTETSAGAFSALSGSSSAGSAFDSVEAKLDTYKATIRGKIEERYHTVDGIAAKADAFQNTIRARLAKL